jgi:hypothetical protein
MPACRQIGPVKGFPAGTGQWQVSPPEPNIRVKISDSDSATGPGARSEAVSAPADGSAQLPLLRECSDRDCEDCG